MCRKLLDVPQWGPHLNARAPNLAGDHAFFDDAADVREPPEELLGARVGIFRTKLHETLLHTRRACPVEPAHVEDGVAQSRHALVVLENDRLEIRSRREELDQGLDDVPARVQALAAQGVGHTHLREEPARAALASECGELRVGAVHGHAESERQIAFE